MFTSLSVGIELGNKDLICFPSGYGNYGDQEPQ